MPNCFLVEPVFDETVEYSGVNDWMPVRHSVKHWIRRETGEIKQWPHEFGTGAMWVAIWYPRNFEWDNETEPHVIVRTPGGDWDIDSRASNCTLPNDKTHRCWVRHGIPPNLTVNKNGVTCAAGAGSIQCGSYHGFLQNGAFT